MIDTETEVLYLARGERDVLVEKCPKRQDVIDGIRFLYRQYVKKKPGVILNDPEKCISIIQTVLLINSVRPLLDRPTLVLCDEGVEQKWLDHFATWTDMGHDITADTTNPFTKKVSVYITPVTEMGKYYSRDWSVIIVDSDIVHREILKDKLSGRFKIWITCVHVKENLNIFSQLYKWLYPKQTFDAKLFENKKNNPYDRFTREIMLESFMEDIVLKRNVKCVNNNLMPSSPPPKKVTRKNKDATGTKIKRTKRKNRILSDEDTPNKINKTAEISNIEQNSFDIGEEISNVSSRNLTTTSNTTISNSITNIESDDEMGNDQRDANREISKISNHSYKETDVFETENNHETSKTLKDGNEVIVRDFAMENDQMDKFNNEISIQNDSNIEPDILRAENAQNNEDSSIKSDNSTNLLLQFDEESTPLIIDESKSNDSEYDKDTQLNELESVQYFDEIKTNINEIETKITDTKTNLNIIGTNSILDVNEIKNNENQNTQSENVFSTASISDLNKTKDELNKINNKEVNKVENDKTDSNIDSSSVDYKMRQLEELALKKFKGSFLDSLF